MTPIEIYRLAGAIATLRPDWPAGSLQTFIARHFTHRPIRDITVALAYVALDPDSTSPGRVLEAGPWWQAAATSDVPTAVNDCTRHPLAGLRVDPVSGRSMCAGCYADRRADDQAAARFQRQPVPDDVRAELERLRTHATAPTDATTEAS